MNSLERVRKTIDRQPVDRIPVYPMINQIARRYVGCDFKEWVLNPEICAKSILKATDKLNLDIISTQLDLSLEASDWGMKVCYPTNSPPEPVAPRLLRSHADYDMIRQINPRETPRMSEYIRLASLLSEKSKDKYILGYIFGPLGILSMMRGMGELFYDIIEHPQYVHGALSNISDTIRDLALCLLEKGCHGIMFNTIYASEYIMPSVMWEEFEGVYLQKICEEIRHAGGDIFLQSTMDNSYFQTQIEKLHPDVMAFLSLPNECSSLRKMKKLYGKHTVLMGQINPEFLTICTDSQLRAECRRQIEAYKPGGGYILATGYEYPDTLSDRYARIMVEEALL